MFGALFQHLLCTARPVPVLLQVLQFSQRGLGNLRAQKSCGRGDVRLFEL